MSFYGTLLSCVYKGHSTEYRVRESFKLARNHYNAIHAHGGRPPAFTMVQL